MTSVATSTPPLPEDQLLELLVQLQKTTPDQARAILNSQPAIGYALIPLMAKLGVMNLDVLQKTLAAYTGTSAGPSVPAPAPVPPPVPTIPVHLTQTQAPYGHQPTPPPVASTAPPVASSAPTSTPIYSGATNTPSGSAYPAYPSTQAQNGVSGSAYAGTPQYGGQYQQQQQQPYSGASSLGQPQTTSTNTPPPGGAQAMLSALGNIPDDQREMIMRMISMTPEQIRALPPQERTITIQLRATLGLSAE